MVIGPNDVINNTYDILIVESHDSKIISKKLLSILPVWYNESSFLYVEND